MRISHASPIGAVLMGRKVGDKVTAKTPAGSIELNGHQNRAQVNELDTELIKKRAEIVISALFIF
jgi:hypothetical protein